MDDFLHAPPSDATAARHLCPAALLAAPWVALLAACGGGGDLPLGSAPPLAASGPSAPTDPLDLCGNATTVGDVLARLNAKRSQPQDCGARGAFAATTALGWSASLTQAAAAHSRDMADNDYFDHVSPGGVTLAMRVNATGYAWSRIGENIAGGPTTVDAVIDGWMASDGHCANIMQPGFREVGLACASNAASTFRTYWTLVLAAPR